MLQTIRTMLAAMARAGRYVINLLGQPWRPRDPK